MKLAAGLVFLFLASSVFAGDCVENARGKTVCAKDGKAVAYNPQTGTATKSSQNANGVTTSQTSKGGEAKTKNGKGVAEGPGGTKCVKTANNHACR